MADKNIEDDPSQPKSHLFVKLIVQSATQSSYWSPVHNDGSEQSAIVGRQKDGRQKYRTQFISARISSFCRTSFCQIHSSKCHAVFVLVACSQRCEASRVQSWADKKMGDKNIEHNSSQPESHLLVAHLFVKLIVQSATHLRIGRLFTTM